MAKIVEMLRDFRKPKQLSIEDYILKLKATGYTQDGKLIPDPVPIAPPIGYKKQPTMVELIRDMVRGENLRRLAEEQGAETLEQADDFEIGDDPPSLESGYENDLDPPLTELLTAGRQELANKQKPEQAIPPPAPPVSPLPPSPNPVKPE